MWHHCGGEVRDILPPFASLRLLSESPQPILTGSLRKTPLAEFLIQAYDGGLEGTLLLQTAEREKSAVWFVRGAPAKARPHDKSITLGRVMVELGLVSQDLATSSQKQAQAEKRLHGEIMLERGYVDQTGLYVGLREQLLRQSLLLCDLPESTGFGFYRENFLATWGHHGQWRVKPLRIIWRAVADHLPEARREAWLAKIAEAQLRLRPDAPVSRYGLTKKESAVIDMMRVKHGSFDDLVATGAADPATIKKVVAALLLTRQLDLGFKNGPVGLHEPPETPQSVVPPETRAARRSQSVPRGSGVPTDLESAPLGSRPRPDEKASRPPLRSSSPRPQLKSENALPRRSITAPAPSVSVSEAPQSELSEEAAALAEAIERYQSHPPKNHYETLGLERGADSSRVRTAFFQLARKWHPDKLPSELNHLRAIVNRAFSEMGEAHQTLMDDQRRVEYDRGLDNVGDDEQEQVASILRAASAHQRAEILYKKKSYREALADATLAYEADPSQPDYVALYAWLYTLVHPGEDHRQQLELISKTLETNPDHVRALWYRGQLYKKTDQPSKALRDFKHIVAVKPNHVDAAREVRVYKMRRQTDPKSGASSPKPSGLFGAFRKKS